MRSFTTLAATLAVFASNAYGGVIEERQVVYGCYFNVDGIVNQYVTVGSDLDRTGRSGKSWLLDCGTTSSQIVPGVFAKCTIDDVAPFSITAIPGDNANINCTYTEPVCDCGN